MEGAPSEESVFEQLASARASLAAVLPPQADKILHSLQRVELALQYWTMDGRRGDVLDAARNALKTLNLIERRRELPPNVGLAVSRAICELTKIVRAARATEQADRSMRRDAAPKAEGPPRVDRRKSQVSDHEYMGPRRRSDDTVDALECLDEELLQVG
jgi:hypothetical protein